MTDIDERGYDPEARRRLAALDEVLARWAEETGDRLRLPEGAGDRLDAAPGPRARRPGGEAAAPDHGTGGVARRPRPGSHRWAWPSGVLAAAAAVVAILLVRQPRDPGPSSGEGGIPLAADDLDAASDRSFMVVPTRNPDIAVIWMLDSGD